MRKWEEYGRIKQTTEGNTIRRMRYACNITKPADTHSEYVILIAFILHRRSSMLPSYAHRLSCWPVTTVTVYEGVIRYSCFGIKISSLWLWPPCLYAISHCIVPKCYKCSVSACKTAGSSEKSLVVAVCHCTRNVSGRVYYSCYCNVLVST